MHLQYFGVDQYACYIPIAEAATCRECIVEMTEGGLGTFQKFLEILAL